MPKTKYYEDEMVKKTFRFPQEICEWLDQKTNTSEAIRDIIDAKLKISQKRNVPAYVLPKRPHKGRPRKDEDPNYVPPVKKPRGRPRKDEAKSISEKV